MRQPHPLIRHLKDLRTEQGLSLYAADKRAHLGVGAVRNWEIGRYGPTVHGLEQYAALFGLRLALVPESETERLHAQVVARLELELVPERPTADELPPVTPAMAEENLRALAEAIGDWPAEEERVAS